jgi:phage/plasmid-like protein (TIGR03299 family)
MAHNLNEVEGKVSFASTQTAWHGLGQIVDNPMTTAQAIVDGGLNYEVEKVKLYTGIGERIEMACATQRTDTQDILGVVGNKYEVVQNRDAFDFFDSLLGSNHAKIETVGALGMGERIFITAKLPHVMTIGKDDLTEMYILLTSSHDGSGAVVAGITPIRVVCQNTLNFAMSKGLKNRISIRHTLSAKERISQAGEVLKVALEYQTTLENAYNFLYRTRVTDTAAKDLIMKIMGTCEKSSYSMGILGDVEKLYHTGIGQESIVGSAWGVFNAITNYTSHAKSYKNAESKFNSLLMGGESEKLVKKSFDTIMQFATSN